MRNAGYTAQSRQTYRFPTYSRIRSPHHQWHVGWMMSILGVIALIVFLAASFWQYEYGSEKTVTFTITRLDDQAQSKGHKYLIFGTDPQGKNVIYENTDAWFHGKTDSSDIWAAMQVGQTWRCPVYGYRIHISSSYQDILDGCKLLRG